MAHENVLTLHCALSDRFQKMHLTLALYAMHMTQLESIEYIISEQGVVILLHIAKDMSSSQVCADVQNFNTAK